MSDAYGKFMERIAELADIGHAEGMLSWDQETYMPPKGAAMESCL